MHGGEGRLCLPGNVRRFERSESARADGRSGNGEREPANELEGRSGAVENGKWGESESWS